MSKIWICSDWHFGHNKDFIYIPRGFSSEEEMTETLIKNHNELVSPEDTVYCLGDVMLGDSEKGISALSKLNGTINIIRGNHCTDTKCKMYKSLPNVNFLGNAITMRYRKFVFYLSHYPTLTGNFDFDQQLYKKVINLCGHSHTKDMFSDWDKYSAPIIHCEVDCTNNKPIELDTIIELMKEKRKA